MLFKYVLFNDFIRCYYLVSMFLVIVIDIVINKGGILQDLIIP